MPYPSKLNHDIIVQVAWEMIESAGVDHFSMHKLAAHFNVKTASLYRYYKKTALLRAVNEQTFRRLFAAIIPAMNTGNTPQERLLAVSYAYRQFAHEHPTTYGLVYTNTINELRPDEDEQEEAVLPFQAIITEITGEADSLPALRGLLALMHGFAMLELAGQFRRGGDLDEAFMKVVEAYLAGWAAS